LSDGVWVAMEAPRRYRKMIGSKTSIRLCTLCYEEGKKVVYGEYEVTLRNPGDAVLVCQSHKDKLKAEGSIQKQS